MTDRHFVAGGGTGPPLRDDISIGAFVDGDAAPARAVLGIAG